MEKQDRLIILFDYYEKLLTESQRLYFMEYYFNNLSLSEIADLCVVSRNAVSKELKLATEKLNTFEEKLKLYSKDKEIRKLVLEIKDVKLQEKFNKILDE